MEDSAIVDLYWRRSEQAIAESERKYGTYCSSIAQRICRSARDAEECVNDTWLSAWNTMPDKRPERLGLYLGCLTRHAAISRLRAENSLKRGGAEIELVLDELAEVLPTESDPAREFETRELGEAVSRFVDGLGETERNIFLGRYFFGYPVKTIAARCGYTESRTKSILFRLRARLRRTLETEGLL